MNDPEGMNFPYYLYRKINSCTELILFVRNKNFVQNDSSSKSIDNNIVMQEKIQTLAVMTIAHDSQLI